MTGSLLVTTTRAVFVLDLASRTAWQILTGHGVYYGVTFDTERCYVAARFARYGSERSGQDNAVLCLDRDARLVKVLRGPHRIRDVHQIAWHAGTLYIVSTYDDCLVLHDVQQGRWERWFPFGGDAESPPNQHHINSIHVGDRRILVAGNKPGGWSARFDGDRRMLGPGREAMGDGTHNIWPEPDDAVGVCSSLDGRIVSTHGSRPAVDPRAWLRGIARIGQDTFLGVSQNRIRDMRESASSSVVRVDAEGQTVECWTFAGFGMVHDIRALAVPDPTHNGIAFAFRPRALNQVPVSYQTARDLVDLDGAL